MSFKDFMKESEVNEGISNQSVKRIEGSALDMKLVKALKTNVKDAKMQMLEEGFEPADLVDYLENLVRIS